jgi:hypothetical protein
MIFLCQNDNGFTSSDASDYANVVIAVCNLILAGYIFFYQRNKDKFDREQEEIKEQSNKIESLKLQEQNIKLQWFKELIIQPHLQDINTFYSKLHSLEEKINTKTLSEEQKFELVNFIKLEQSNLRKSFVDVLHGVDKKLYDIVIENLDSLIDLITNTIFNDGFNLTHKPTFDKEIGSKITYSRNDLISKIYNYKGI